MVMNLSRKRPASRDANHPICRRNIVGICFYPNFTNMPPPE